MASPPTMYAIPGGGTLRGDAAASYLRMRAAGMPAGGIDAWSRTYAQQAELRRRYEAGLGPLAAKPNANAPHIKGVAIDLHTTTAGKYAPSAAHKWLTQGGDGSDVRKGEKIRANGYGFVRTVNTGPRRERWHFAYDPAKDTKAAADLAARLKALGFKDVKTFQRSKGLAADGKAGPQTWTALLAAQPAAVYTLGDRILKRGDTGPDVAELSALLTRAGYAVGAPVDSFGPMVEQAVKAVQKSAKLTVDGKVGPKTIAALRAIPDPPRVEPAPIPVPPLSADFRFGLANLQAARFGGLSDTSARRGEYLRDKMACSLYVLTEVPEKSRDTIRKVLGAAWKVYPTGYIGILWDSAKWIHRDRMSVDFGTGVHGAVRAELRNAATGLPLDVIGVHVRPAASFGGDAAKAKAGKQRDIAKMLSVYRKGISTIIAGDFNTPDTQALARSGLVRATPAVDTLDKAGVQPLDQVWVTPDLIVRGTTLLDPGSLTDHRVWVAQLTLGGSTL